MIYFTSDWHLWHKNVLLFDKQRWDVFLWPDLRKEINDVWRDSSKTKEEILEIRKPYDEVMTKAMHAHDLYILNKINSLSWNDTVYFLWDLCFSRNKKYMSYIKEMIMSSKCSIHWVYWNHDHKKEIKFFGDCFDIAQYYIQKNINWRLYCMMHYPIESWNRKHHWSIMIHGHLHQRPLYVKWFLNKAIDFLWIKSIVRTSNRFDVSYDWWQLLYSINELCRTSTKN
jgi:calcineurin-like phosphoesterase family protein